MIVDEKEIYEHKIKKAGHNDVMQIFGYILHTENITKGTLWAPEFNDKAKETVAKLNEFTEFEITLNLLSLAWTYPAQEAELDELDKRSERHERRKNQQEREFTEQGDK